MRIGRLDRRIRIEFAVEVRTTDGHLDQRWQTFAEVWAERMPGGGSERYVGEAEQRVNTQRRVYRIRWREGVTPRMRLVDANTIWDIEDVSEGERRREELLLTCHAHEVVSGDPQEEL